MEESTQEESCTISEPSPSSSSPEEQYGAGAVPTKKVEKPFLKVKLVSHIVYAKVYVVLWKITTPE